MTWGSPFMNLKRVFVLLALVFTSLGFQSSVIADNSGDTKYPIVLVHGLSGFDNVVGVEYFYNIKPALANVGAGTVYTPQVSAFESNTARGEELLAYVENLVAITGHSKVNLIGHSQGGPTARYVASVRPDLVASVTSVGSPHFGSPVADLVNQTPAALIPTVANIVNAFGNFLATITGDPNQQSNSLGALNALSTQGAASFNAMHPQGLRQGSCKNTPLYNANYGWTRWIFPKWRYDYSVNDGAHSVNGVRYYSWSGTYNSLTNSNVLDIADGFLGLAQLVHTESNDGLVGRCSSHMGKVIRDDYVLNHLDEVNMAFGLRGLGTSNPVSIYVDHARRLKSAGL